MGLLQEAIPPVKVVWPPVATVSGAGFMVFGATAPLHNAVNESTPDDNSIIYGGGNSTISFQLRLGGSAPGSIVGAILSVRLWTADPPLTMTVTLGGKTFSSTSVASSATTYTYTISEADASSWDLGNLIVQCSFSKSGYSDARVSWISLTINPDA